MVNNGFIDFVSKGEKWEFANVNFLQNETSISYTVPNFNWENDLKLKAATYLVISAPGAIGKSAFSKYLAATKNAMVWDLSKLKLGSNTFIGSIVQAVGVENLQQFLLSIKQGKTTLIFDAVDEAELHSGWDGVNEFLKDVVNQTSDATSGSVIFLGRRDSAELVELCLGELVDEAKIARASIGYFSRENAKNFIVSQMKKSKLLGSNRGIIFDKIDEAFEIPVVECKAEENILGWDSVEHEKFFGYAPVLQTIAKLLDETENLFKFSLNASDDGYADVIARIINLIQEREKNKFIDSVRQRFGDKFDFDLSEIYSAKDQMQRITSYLNKDEIEAFKAPSSIPVEAVPEFLEMLKTFLPQHPFLEVRDYAGPAFRDYAVAYSLVNHDLRFGMELWLDSKQSLSSPILASLYHLLGEGKADPKDIELLYESINSGAELNNSGLFVSEKEENLIVEIVSSDEGPLGKSLEFEAVKPEYIYFSRRLSNARVFSSAEVILGRGENDFDMLDCEIVARKIKFLSEKINIRSISTERNFLESQEEIQCLPATKLSVNPEGKLSVIAPNSKKYPWSKYSVESDNKQEVQNTEATLHVMARILGWFRKDRRDEYGRYKDLIIKHVVGSSPTARYALGFIDHIGALSENGTLYFIDTNKLDEIEISWQKIRSGNVSDKAITAVGKYLAETPHPPSFQ